MAEQTIVYLAMIVVLCACHQGQNDKEVRHNQRIYKQNQLHQMIQQQEVHSGINRVLARMIRGDSVRLVCWGNSITYGFRADRVQQGPLPYPQALERLLQQRYRNPFIQVVNQGHPGWRSWHAIAYVDTIVALAPDVCFIHFGINDAVSGIAPSAYLDNIAHLCNYLHTRGIEVVVLTPTPIVRHAPDMVADYAKQLVQWCNAHAIPCVDAYTDFCQRAEKQHMHLEQILPDGIHPEAPYYEWIAFAIMDWWQRLPR